MVTSNLPSQACSPPPLLHPPLPLIPGGLLSVQDLNSFEEILLVSAGEEDHFSFLRELGIKRFISFQLGLFLCLIGAAEHFSTLNLVPHSRTKQCAVAGNLHMQNRREHCGIGVEEEVDRPHNKGCGISKCAGLIV